MQKGRFVDLDKISERRMAVEIIDRHQEKEFSMICRRLGEPIVKKDDTAYRKINGRREQSIQSIMPFLKPAKREEPGGLMIWRL